MVKVAPPRKREQVAAAIGRLDEAAAVGIGPPGDQADRAADRVAALERALRAAQDLDPLEVEQVEVRAGQRRIIDVVDIDADAGLEGRVEVELADAADRRADRGTERGALLAQHDVRGLVGDLDEAVLAARLEQLAGNGGDRQRRVLQPLLAELGGDEDFLLAALPGGCPGLWPSHPGPSRRPGRMPARPRPG